MEKWATNFRSEKLLFRGFRQDPKDTDKDYYFEIPQNVEEPKIRILKDFLFVATCSLSQMEKLSPAFLNRFKVINLEEQLEGATEKEEKEAIKYIIESEKIELTKKKKLLMKSILFIKK